MALEYPAVPAHLRTPARVQSGAYSNVSLAIEPIQLPIVPLSLFPLHPLRNTAARERGADRSANGGNAERRTVARGP
jgi:hypothetical protein